MRTLRIYSSTVLDSTQQRSLQSACGMTAKTHAKDFLLYFLASILWFQAAKGSVLMMENPSYSSSSLLPAGRVWGASWLRGTVDRCGLLHQDDQRKLLCALRGCYALQKPSHTWLPAAASARPSQASMKALF